MDSVYANQEKAIFNFYQTTLSYQQVNITKRFHLTILLTLLLCLFSAIIILLLGIPNGLSIPIICLLSILFIVITLIGLWRLFYDRRIYTIADSGLYRKIGKNEEHFPRATIREIIFEQVLIHDLAVGYNYHHGSTSPTVKYRAVDLGLQLIIKSDTEDIIINDTMTTLPIELIYQQLCEQYHIEGHIVLH